MQASIQLALNDLVSHVERSGYFQICNPQPFSISAVAGEDQPSNLPR